MRTKILLVPIILSWIVGVIPHFIGRDFLLRERLLPALPNVSLPIGSESDFVSIVPHLFRALAIGLIAVICAEPSKYWLASAGRRFYLFVVVYQAVLFLDLLRWYAYDWFLYSLHFVRVIDLNSNPAVLKRWGAIGAPWISLLCMVLLLAVILRSQRSREVLST
jgi:hypothetical protein